MRRILLALVVVVAACGTPAESGPTTIPANPPPTMTTTTVAATTTETAALADSVTPLGSALFVPDAVGPPPPAPVSLTVEGVPIEEAPIRPVGVESNGEMEIPGAREVGWYRFGPTPRQGGSAVLAAHIAWNGRNGVFRRLADVEIGAVVTVGYEDGTTSRHVVTEIAQYPKDRLPTERVFARSGGPLLTLITCGGAFNRSLDAYDDNIVVYASPLD